MGKGSGTGSPVWFRCFRERRGVYHERNSRIELTGRQRPAKFKRAPGSRSSFIEREYHCTACGYTGWSNHVELAHMAGEGKYTGTDFEDIDTTDKGGSNG